MAREIIKESVKVTDLFGQDITHQFDIKIEGENLKVECHIDKGAFYKQFGANMRNVVIVVCCRFHGANIAIMLI